MPSKKRNRWEGKGRAAENDLRIKLNKIVATIRSRLSTALGADYDTLNNIAAEFERLGDNLDDFAFKASTHMLRKVNRTVLGLFIANKEELSPALRRELQDDSHISQVYRSLMDEQMKLIQNIPRDVAQQIREKATQYQTEGLRSDDPSLIEFIQERANVARSRAKMIARTQVSAATTSLVQSRATSIGSEGYIWRTSNDAIVRPSHAKLNGTFVRWDKKPDPDGLEGHAGSIPNCRCTCEVVFVD